MFVVVLIYFILHNSFFFYFRYVIHKKLKRYILTTISHIYIHFLNLFIKIKLKKMPLLFHFFYKTIQI